LASLSVLFALFSVIGGFIAKLWWDERQSKRRAEALLAMGINERDNQAKTGGNRGGRSTAEWQGNEDASGDEEEDEDVPGSSVQFGEKKIGKKKLAKLQAKAESKALREQEQAERQEKKKQEELRLKKEEEDRRLEELEELKRKERLRAEQEEKRRKEQAEYDMLKESFAVEEQGYDQVEEEESGNLMRAFIDYVTKTKVVFVDELAPHFRLSSEDVVKRLEMLVEEKLLTGVFDDRGPYAVLLSFTVMTETCLTGKFIYISPEELVGVSKFINQRGRVTIRELADYSNRLISLE